MRELRNYHSRYRLYRVHYFVVAKRIIRYQVVFDEAHGVLRGEIPIDRTGRENLHDREAEAIQLGLERRFDSLLGSVYAPRVVNRTPHDVAGPFKCGKHL